jgi:apolipoprotein N-acyltransferase
VKALAAILALALSGVAFFFYAPPRSWIWLQLIAWVPAFFVLAQLRGRRAFFAGWFVGTLTILSGYYWVAETVERFSSLPTAVAWSVGLAFAAAHGIYLGLFAWGFAPVRRACGRAWPFGIAAWFTALEFLTPQLFPHYQGSM